VGYYAYQALYSIANNLGESGVVASRLGTPNLTWEKNLNLNIALDFGLWNNRLNGSIEFFDRRSKDLLFSLDLVPSSGYTSMDANIGALKNVGWEIQLNGQPSRPRTGSGRLSANATTYKNTITSLPADEMWSGNKKWVKGAASTTGISSSGPASTPRMATRSGMALMTTARNTSPRTIRR
jgi:hypothetical protein